MEYGIYAAIFILLLGAVALVAWGTRKTGSKEEVMSSLDKLEAYDSQAFRRAELDQPASQRILAPAVRRLTGVARGITPSSRIRKLERKIEAAGRPGGLDVNALLVLKFVSLAAGLVILVVLAAVQVLPLVWFVILAVFVVLFTYYLPDIILNSATNTRRQQIARSLPDFLDLLTVSVEAGLGLDSAMAKIAERMRGPLKEEILITLHEIRMGKTRASALRAMADRCQVDDLTTFITALIQSQQLGISLGQVLRVQAEQIRTIQRQRIEERAQKAPVKLLVPLLLCIFPAMFVVIVGPAVIRIYEALLGY
jgi:tight adherence protein C